MAKISFSDLRLMSILPQVLSKYLQPNELEDVISSIRDNLYDGYYKPTHEGLYSTIKNCRRCIESENKVDGPQLPMWNIQNPKALFITEQKLTNNDSINLFLENLKEVGFSSADICLSSMVRCPFKPKPEADDIDRCSEYIWSEIEVLSPHIVVPMGASVTKFFISEEKIGTSRGKEHWIGPWMILPTYSPDYVVRNGSDKMRDAFISDIRKIKSKIEHHYDNNNDD